MKGVNRDQSIPSYSAEGMLAPYIASFVNSMASHGYSVRTLRSKARLASGFSRWLEQTEVSCHCISSDTVSRYLKYRAQYMQHYGGDNAALRQFVDFLTQCGVIPVQRKPAHRRTSIELRADEYKQYLREVRGLTEPVVANYAAFAVDFLREHFGAGRVNLSRLRSCDVIRFVQRKAPQLHLRYAKLMLTALRSFLRYLRYRGDLVHDLAEAVPAIANWSMPSIPRAIAPDQIRKLLSSIDRRTAIGRRDYAIVLLLARLGLRAGEVAFLDLADIDWATGRLTVRNKCSQRIELPLQADVGRAISAYLKHGRPNSSCRRVFLRTKAPITGFRNGTSIGSVVRHALERACIDAPTAGSHQFRHGLATDMLSHGASLGEIGEILGHRDLQTTMIYAKVDIKALRTIAAPWPRGVR